MHEGLAIRETREAEGENEESWLSAFLVCLISRSFRITTVILERRWPRKRESTTEETRNSLFLRPLCLQKGKMSVAPRVLKTARRNSGVLGAFAKDVWRFLCCGDA